MLNQRYADFKKQKSIECLHRRLSNLRKLKGQHPLCPANKNDTLRFWVDNRKLNAVTKRGSNPIPHMEKGICELENAAIFKALDANSGCRQIKTEKSDRCKTAFTSHHWLYRFTRMSFGQHNAPETLLQTLNVILFSVKLLHALVNRDNLVVFSKTPGEHIALIDIVLSFLYEAVLSLEFKNLDFLQKLPTASNKRSAKDDFKSLHIQPTRNGNSNRLLF